MRKLIGKTVNVDYYESMATMKSLKGVVLTGVEYNFGMGYCVGCLSFNNSIYINSTHIIKIELVDKSE